MPIYCYECPRCGGVTERLRPAAAGGAGGAPRSAPCGRCGAAARRSYAAEAGRNRPAGGGEIRSLAAGVMPQQAAEANRRAAALGLADCVRFDARTGDAIFAGRGAKLRAIRAMGLHDRNEIRG